MKFYLLEDNERVKKKLNFFKRNILLLSDHLVDIIEEYVQEIDICQFDDFDEFYENIVNDSGLG